MSSSMHSCKRLLYSLKLSLWPERNPQLFEKLVSNLNKRKHLKWKTCGTKGTKPRPNKNKTHTHPVKTPSRMLSFQTYPHQRQPIVSRCIHFATPLCRLVPQRHPRACLSFHNPTLRLLELVCPSTTRLFACWTDVKLTVVTTLAGGIPSSRCSLDSG